MRVAHNRISGGYFGVEAAPTTTVSVDDVATVGNQVARRGLGSCRTALRPMSPRVTA
jgi:hypothetical protein